ncbi:MAG: hypothetical protein D4R73_08140 [Deltaproteobacteria bacterium]|nr:MAG: hypothetical protein D4R73_08140 [Deltaproteobacteria bacterium]
MEEPKDPMHLRLVADGLEALHEPLKRMEGKPLSERFQLCGLWAVGGQSVLFGVTDAEQPSSPLLARFGLLPYHRPAHLSQQQIIRSRQRIEQEAEILRRFGGPIMPAFHELIYSDNPLLSLEWGDLKQNEPFLIMELIGGITLKEWINRSHIRDQSFPDVNEMLALSLARTAIELFRQLARARYLYADFNPANVRVIPEQDWKVRILDAGSIIPQKPDPAIDIPYTSSYIPPDYYYAYQSGRQIWPDEKFVAYTLGVSLWQLLTNRQPFPAQTPDGKELDDKGCSIMMRELVMALLSGVYSDFDALQAVIDQMRLHLPKDG